MVICVRGGLNDAVMIWAARSDITLEELRAGLAEMGPAVSVAGLPRFIVSRGRMRKKLLMQSSKIAPMS